MMTISITSVTGSGQMMGLDDLDDGPTATKDNVSSVLDAKGTTPLPHPVSEEVAHRHIASVGAQSTEPILATIPEQGNQSSNAPPPPVTHEVDALGLTPELRAERDILLRKLDEIAEIKNHFRQYNKEGDEDVEQLATRKRFVSRAEMFNNY